MSEVLSEEEREYLDAQGMEEEGEEEVTAATQTQEETETAGAEGGGNKGKTAKYPCIVCKNNVGRTKGIRAVQCKTCKLWVHADCEKMSKDVYTLLKQHEKTGGISWTCRSCLASAARLDAAIKNIECRVQEVEVRLVRNEGNVQAVERRMDIIEKKQEDVERQETERENKIGDKLLEEIRERKQRKLNVIIHRVGEAGDEAREIEERKDWDLDSCDNIFEALGIRKKSRETIKFIRRVGESGGEDPRPMLVGFHKKEDKSELMEKARQLRNTIFKEVTIVPDITPQQRKEEADMGREAERRNETRTEEERSKNVEWMVVGKKGEKRLIKGVPRQWGEGMRGRGGGVWRGGAERGGRGLGLGSTLLPGRGGQGGATWRPETGTVFRETGQARGGETGAIAKRGTGWRGGEDRMRRNSKRNRGESDPETERTDGGPPPAKH